MIDDGQNTRVYILLHLLTTYFKLSDTFFQGSKEKNTLFEKDFYLGVIQASEKIELRVFHILKWF